MRLFVTEKTHQVIFHNESINIAQVDLLSDGASYLSLYIFCLLASFSVYMYSIGCLCSLI